MLWEGGLLFESVWLIDRIDDIRAMINGIQLWFVGYIIREATETTHRLAKAVVHQSLEPSVWMEDNPIFIG